MTNLPGFVPFDADAFNKTVNNSADWSKKVADTTLRMFQESSAISQGWALQSIDRYSKLAEIQSDPTTYARALTEFTTDGLKTATTQFAAYAEIARKTQSEYLDILLASPATAQPEPANVAGKPAASRGKSRSTAKTAKSA